MIAIDCNSLETIFQFLLSNSLAKNAAIGIPLKGLNLYRLSNLLYVWDKDPQGTVTFQNLSTIKDFQMSETNECISDIGSSGHNATSGVTDKYQWDC